MRTWPAGMVLMCCGSLLLTGCYNQDQFRSLKKSQADTREEVQALRKQVKALGDFVEVLKSEIVAMRPALAAESAALSAPATESVASQQKTPQDSTPSEFEKSIRGEYGVGMSSQQVIKVAGNPDSQSTIGDTTCWIYNKLPCKDNNGTINYRSAKIVFENGRVSGVSFAADIRYGPETPVK